MYKYGQQDYKIKAAVPKPVTCSDRLFLQLAEDNMIIQVIKLTFLFTRV